MSEFDFEPVRGLPGDLPAGEHILWQGAPDWKVLAAKVFHVPLVGLYFVGLMAWRITNALAAGETVTAALTTALWVTPLALLAMGLLAVLAWVNSRTTVYTITNRRVVMRFGAALTKAINIPFGIVEGASLQGGSRGTGDLAMTLAAPNKIAYLQLWPHARPGRLQAPQPTFRAIPDAAHVATLLTDAVRAAAPSTETVQTHDGMTAEPARHGGVTIAQPAFG
jgi:Bacterial PH domain